MTQFNLDTPINPNTKSGSVLASDLSAWRDALNSCHSGTTRPSYVAAGTLWIDTSTTTWVANIYDGSQDIILGTLDTTTDTFIPGADAATVFADIKQTATTTATGVVELATNTEALAGTDPDRVVTPAALASSKLYATDGYQKLPGGLIIQWGTETCPGEGSVAVTFPLTFPTAAFSLTSTPIGATSGGGTSDFWGYTSLITTGFTQNNRYDGAHTFTYIVIGN